MCGGTANTPQGGQLATQLDPAAESGGPAKEQQFVYDSAGRVVGHRTGPSDTISTAGWECTTYDSRGRGRLVSHSWPATGSAPSRTVTYTYAVGGNPLVSSVSDTLDPGGTITSTVDLLGRVTSYTDAAQQATTTTYDQVGRISATSGPQGDLVTGFGTSSGKPATLGLDSVTVATATYDPATKRLSQVVFGNGTTATLGYDAYGSQASLVFTNSATGALVAGNSVTRSAGGRIVSELQDLNGSSLTNANPAGATAVDYTYDGAGRLTAGSLPGATATYGYANNPAADGCATATAGLNTNRTSVTVTPSTGSPTTTDYCYNNADQLTSSIQDGTTDSQYGYDDHGNQTDDHGSTLSWDASDRLVSVTTAGTTTTYSYDAVDRLIATSDGTATTTYSYAGFTDVPAATIVSGAVTQRLISLPAGVNLAKQATGDVWSYPDLHGNYTVTTGADGIPRGTPASYDPWGAPTPGSAAVSNLTGSYATYADYQECRHGNHGACAGMILGIAGITTGGVALAPGALGIAAGGFSAQFGVGAVVVDLASGYSSLVCGGGNFLAGVLGDIGSAFKWLGGFF